MGGQSSTSLNDASFFYELNDCVFFEHYLDIDFLFDDIQINSDKTQLVCAMITSLLYTRDGADVYLKHRKMPREAVEFRIVQPQEPHIAMTKRLKLLVWSSRRVIR